MAIYETIKYDVIKKEGPIEIRQYNNVLLASTKTKVNTRQDSGFNNVFQYITGNNKAQEKISMTTPVVTYQDDQELVTGFYVPSKYDKDTVPEPLGNVFINELESSLYAVIRFRGSWTESNYKKQDETLIEYIKSNGYVTLSPRILFRYQPPLVPGPFRRNEIAYQISKTV